MKKLNNEDLIVARKRLIKMHYESKVGHIGGNLSSIDAIMLILNEYIYEEDEFILSKGHSAGALYIALWSIGLISDEELRTFHNDNTVLPGHPPANIGLKISFATGSLGHGLSLAAGTALAYKFREKKSNIFCFTSDGEWQEGSTWEALIFACHHKLNNLTILVDHNNLQGFGNTKDVASMSPLWERLRGFEIEIHIVDGHDLNAIRQSLAGNSTKPRVVFLETIKGKGVSFLENRMDSHYLPLSESQYQLAIDEADLL